MCLKRRWRRVSIYQSKLTLLKCHGSIVKVGDLDLEQGQRQRQLRDLEVVDGGARLARYGYLFDLVQEGELRVVRAWPARFGQTGRRAFVHTTETGLDQAGVLNEHANPNGFWSGPDAPPSGPYEADNGWRMVPRDADYR